LRRPQSRGTRCRSPGVSPAAFLAHPPDLQSWPLMDMDFATSCPLVRPVLPRIRLLFVGSRFRSTLPSDSPSRFCPCVSLVLHLHQVAQGTFTPRLLGMPSTQGRARKRAPQAVASLDRSCAPRRLQAVGTKGVPTIRPRLRRVEQRAVQEGLPSRFFGGGPRRRGTSTAGLLMVFGRRASGTKSACWRRR